MTTPLESRGILGFAGAVLAGLISATIFSTALGHTQSFLGFLVYLTAVPLFIAGLGAGSFAGILAAAAGCLNVFLHDASNLAVLYTLIFALPALALTALALRYRAGSDGKVYWYPEGHLLVAIALYPCILFIILNVVAWGHEGGLLALTRETIEAWINAAFRDKPDADTAPVISFYDHLARYIPAMFGSVWTLLISVSMVVSQRSLSQHKWHLRSPFGLRDVYLPRWTAKAIAVLAFVGVLGADPYGYIAINLALMLAMPLLLAALAAVHRWAYSKGSPKTILGAFYLVLAVMPFLAMLTALSWRYREAVSRLPAALPQTN